MDAFNEGLDCALAGGRRSDNPYARGWSRFAALVMPNSFSAVWDDGWQQGHKQLCGIRKEKQNHAEH